MNIHADESKPYWSRTVLDGVAEFTTTHAIAKPGAHVLKFWALDPGVVLEKLVVDAGGLQPSYLGSSRKPAFVAMRVLLIGGTGSMSSRIAELAVERATT